MDYVIEQLLNGGFKPETKREASFVDELKNDGFVFYLKDKNMYKMKDGVIKTETTDEITLQIKPKINYLGLFPNVDNFIASLNPVRFKHVMIEYLGNRAVQESDIDFMLKGNKLGQVYSLTALGYGKNQTNEGYKLEVPEELAPVMYKGNKICYMTTGLSKDGKEKDTKNIDFVGVRPAKILFRLGLSTTFGVFYSFEEFNNAGLTKVIDKAMLK